MVTALAIACAPAVGRAEPQHLKVGGATLSFGIGDQSEGDKLDDLTLTLERGGKVVWKLHGWKAIAGGKAMPAALTGRCESFAVDVAAQKLGKHDGARLDVGCQFGEDTFVADGVAIVIDTLDPYAVLYVGDGDSVHSENDACVSEHTVRFQLDGKKLVELVTDSERTNADGSCTPDGKPGKPKVKKSRVVHAL